MKAGNENPIIALAIGGGIWSDGGVDRAAVNFIPKPVRFFVRMALCGLAVFCCLPGRGQTVADLLQRGWNMQHAVIPVYTEPEKNLSALVHVDKAYTDYEKRGFFHIGALPVAVLEGVTFEARDPAPAAQNLARLASWLGVDAGRHVELRRVKFAASPVSSLEADRVVLAGRDQWELLGGVRLVSGANETRAEKATLQVAGANAGQLILQTTPPSTNTFLFSNPNSNLNSTPK